jgi:zinc transport system permease protein
MISWWLLPLFAGLGVAATAGPLGSLVVWRRMAFFGDTLAHGALLGITLGILLDLNLTLALVFSCSVLALILLQLDKYTGIASDTLLGILSQSSLAIGLVVLSFFDNVRIDLMAYLFGDLLAVNQNDLLWIFAGGSFVIALLIWQWRGLLASTVSEELAAIDGYPVKRLKAMLVLLLALVVAISMKIVGVLLISALLIIPAATARPLAKSPEQMAMLASLIGMISVGAGMAFSFIWDTPTGPSIVVCAAGLFVVSQIFNSIRK